MKNSFILMFFSLCSVCAKDHSVSLANLTCLSVGREANANLYDVRYASDVNVVDLFGRGEREGIASA